MPKDPELGDKRSRERPPLKGKRNILLKYTKVLLSIAFIMMRLHSAIVPMSSR